MTFNEFIFSDKKPYKVRRHLVFWVIFTIQYYVQSLVPIANLFYTALVSVLCFLPACVIAVYTIQYFAPPIINKRQYLRFVSLLVFLTLFLFGVNYLTSIPFHLATCDCTYASLKPVHFVQIASINTAHAMTTGVIILGFSVGKAWILKQKKNQLLLNQKIANELQLQKSALYPDLLLKSLGNLYESLKLGSRESPEIIVKLSDLLSYLLYDAQEKVIPLEKEMAMVSNLISIENMNNAGHFNILPSIQSVSGGRFVRPLILFLFIQNCLDSLRNVRQEQCLLLNLTSNDRLLQASIIPQDEGRQLFTDEWRKEIKLLINKLDAFKENIANLQFDGQDRGIRVEIRLQNVNQI